MKIRKLLLTSAAKFKRAAGLQNHCGLHKHVNSGLFAAIADDSTEGVLIAGPNGVIEWVNRAFSELTGYPGLEAAGKTPQSLPGGTNVPDLYQELGHVLLAGIVWNGEGWIRRKDGAERMVRASVTPVRDSKGRIEHFVAILRAATRQPAYGLTLQNDARPWFQPAGKTAVLALMAEAIAHDLNNLLTVVVGYQDLLHEDHQLPPDATDVVRTIGEAGKRAAALLRPLVAYSRAEPQRRHLVSVNDVITELSPLLACLLGGGIEFSVRLDPQLGTVRANASQVTGIILNLTANARGVLPRGGRLEVTTAPLQIDTTPSIGQPNCPRGAYARLTIAATGRAADRESSAIASAALPPVLEQLDGGIYISSEPGQEPVTHIYLPIAEPGQETPDLPGPERRSILVVDDEPTARDFLSRALGAAGFQVLTAQNGKEAQSLLRRESVDLVITDLVMPEMEGLELIVDLRRRRPSLPIIAISGAFGGLFLKSALALGAHTALAKPIAPSRLLESVRQALGSGTPGTPG